MTKEKYNKKNLNYIKGSIVKMHYLWIIKTNIKSILYKLVKKMRKLDRNRPLLKNRITISTHSRIVYPYIQVQIRILWIIKCNHKD